MIHASLHQKSKLILNYTTTAGTFVPPIREGSGTPEDHWRMARSNAPFRDSRNSVMSPDVRTTLGRNR